MTVSRHLQQEAQVVNQKLASGCLGDSRVAAPTQCGHFDFQPCRRSGVGRSAQGLKQRQRLVNP